MDQIISVASDILLGLGALAAAAYCMVLAGRLKRFNNLENGVGGAVAVLSAQVDDMTRTLDQARRAAAHSSETLTALTERAEDSARKLELMMASLHDLPEAPAVTETAPETSRPAETAPANSPAPESPETSQDAAWKTLASETAQAPLPEAPLFASRRRREAAA